jgi:hypothetical protein
VATTQAQLEAIRKIIATGAGSVAYDGKSTRFRPLAELLALEARMAAELSGTITSRSNVASVSKGTR